MKCGNCGTGFLPSGDYNKCHYCGKSVKLETRSFESLNKPEPMSIPNDNPAIWDLVEHDIRERDKLGTFKYKTRLQGFNGRDALRDAYQEALDLSVYLRQAIFERDGK